MAMPSLSAGGRTAPLVGTPVRTAAAIGGCAAVAATFAKLGVTAEGFTAAFLIATLVLLAVIDIEQGIVPNAIVLPAFAAVLFAQVARAPDQGVEWIIASVGTALVLLVPAVVRRGAVGMGDVKLGLLLGAGLGMEVAQAIVLGLLAAWPVAGYLLLRDGRAAAAAALPLAPFLALGAVAAVLLD
jgi:prepilin signal peptidase PulO-like enzyme (type II secretory pathway)